MEAINVNVNEKKVVVKGHTEDHVDFDYLVLASGGIPRQLSVPGHDLKNIFALRSVSDANLIAEKSNGKKVVVVGSSFIGTEVAGFLSDKAASVTVISRTEFPLETALGKRIGQFVKTLHESKGVKFVCNANVTGLKSKPNQQDEVGFVQLDTQEELLEADVVILGIGVTPSTNYLSDTPVERDEFGNVLVDSNLQSTSVPNVYCAGDIAKFPLILPTLPPNTLACIGHWQLAQSHGRTVGLNIGREDAKKVPFKTVPFFWTVQYGKSIRYAGYCHTQFDEIIYDGSPEDDGAFVAYFCNKNEDVMAVATLGKDPVSTDFANMLLEEKVLKKSDALQGNWREKV